MAGMDTPSTFGDYLRFLRRRARLTQNELGIAVGYSHGQISMLESGIRHPDPVAVAALFVVALGVEKDERTSHQLISLARLAAPIAPQTLAPVWHESGERVVEQVALYQQEELGVLEEIPLLPVYAVGRDQPHQQLQRWCARERAVAICGLAGMGKSTVAALFAREYNLHHPVQWVTLMSDANTSPEALLRQLALFVIAHTNDPTRIAPFFRKAHNQDPVLPFHQQVVMTANALNELNAPLLVLDDAHLLTGQPQTLQMLQRLLALSPQLKVLFVTREEIDLPGVLHMTLEGMNEGEALAVIDKLSIESHFTEEMKQQLLDTTANNPMLLRLAVSHIEQQRATQQPNSGERSLQAPVAGFLIDTVLASLPPDSRRIMEFLSLWRGTVDLHDARLASLFNQHYANHDQRNAIANLQRRRLLEHSAHASPHPLLREALLSELNTRPNERQQTHTLAAAWAMRQGDRVEATHHYAKAGNLQLACDTILSQPAETYQRGQGAAAAAVIEEVLALAHETPSNEGQWTSEAINEIVRNLLVLRGDLLANTTLAETALQSYYDALSLTTRNIDRSQLAEKMAICHYRRGQYEETLNLCEEALDLLGTNLTPAGIRQRIQIESTRLKALIILTRFKEARLLCERSLTLVKPVSLILPSLADTVRAYSNMALGYMARFEGQQELARQYMLKSVKHARAARLADAEIGALSLLSAAQKDLGDFASAEESSQQALTLAQATGNDYDGSVCLHLMSLTSYYHGDLGLALERSRRAQHLKQLIGDFEGLNSCKVVEALVLSEMGQVDEALDCANQALVDSQLLESGWLRSLASYGAGIVYTFSSDLSRAESYLQRAVDEVTPSNDLSYRAGMKTFFGFVYVAQGRLDEAQHIIDQPAPLGAGLDVELMRGLIKAMVLLARGEKAACRQSAERLIARARQIGHLVYAIEAERLIGLIENPPPLAELPRRVCCG